MKFYKLIVLTAVLTLPTQVSLAENAKYLAQPSVNKAPVTATTPAKATSKLKTITHTQQNNVAPDPIATPGPSLTDKFQKPTSPASLPVRDFKIAGQGPNLTVSVRYEHDVCAVDESPLGEGIYDARCDLIITVKNVGDTTTGLPVNGGFGLNLWYYNHNNELKNGFRNIGHLRAKEKKVIVYRSSALRSFNRSTPFTAQVDRSQTIRETNENDNSAVFWLNN